MDHVVPELQRRGLYRTAYTGNTLRYLLGLKRPHAHEGFAHHAAAEGKAPRAARG